MLRGFRERDLKNQPVIALNSLPKYKPFVNENERIKKLQGDDDKMVPSVNPYTVSKNTEVLVIKER